MQKEPDGEVRPQHSQHLRHQLQLIVLDPHRRIRRCRLGGRFCEPPVHLDVAVPPLAVVDRLDDQIVVQRPQGGVGETLVVLGDVVCRQPNRVQLQAVVVDRVFVGVGYTCPPDPRTASAAQQRLERGDQATRAPLPLSAAVWQPLHVDGQPVGHHDEVGIPGAGPWPPRGATYASIFAGPMPSMDRKTRHSSASVAYAATTRLAWRAVLSARGSTSPSSAGSDLAGITQL